MCRLKSATRKERKPFKVMKRDNTDDLSAFFALHVDHRNTSRDVFPPIKVLYSSS